MEDRARELSRRAVVVGLSAAAIASLVDGCAADEGGTGEPLALDRGEPPTDSANGSATPSPNASVDESPTPTPEPVDPFERLRQPRLRHTGLMQTDATGILYAVAPNLDLQWWQHRPDVVIDGGASLAWADASGTPIGTGWDFRSLTSLGFGVLLGLDAAGDVFWYRDLARSGVVDWAAQTGRKVGGGWTADHLVGLPRGHLLAFEPTGEVVWHRWSSAGWHPDSGAVIMDLWPVGSDVVSVFPGGGGLVYTIDRQGSLTGSVLSIPDDDAGTGPANGSTLRVQGSEDLGAGWDEYRLVRATGNGAIYTVDVDDRLRLHQHDIESNWLDRAGVVVAEDFDAIALVASDPVALALRTKAPADAYWQRQSVLAGDTAELAVSTTAASVAVALVRLASQRSGKPTLDRTAVETTLAGRNQGLRPHAWRDGCAWKVDEIEIPTTLKSGLYAAAIRVIDAPLRIVPLVVRPPAPVAPIAVLANTNTWCAYNPWCGVNQYTDPYGVLLSFEKPNPALDPFARITDGDDEGEQPQAVFDHHLLAAEVEIVGWLERSGFDVDLYTDADFHNGIEEFERYRALVLTAHPEYWTNAMMDRLVAYLDGGGSLLYLGGNGLYERIVFADDGRTLVLRNGDPEGERDLLRFNSRSERAVLGVAFEGIRDPSDPPALQRGNAYGAFAPYRVTKAEHRFFKGTGLRNGDAFVTTDGVAGGAGWEVDTSFDDGLAAGAGPAPEGLELLAVGMLGERSGEAGKWTPDHNAHMTTYDHPGGGLVFSAGSLVFGHWLVQDERAQRVVANALNEAVGDS